MASAPYVALLPTAPAGGLRECAVIETMASAPYVALLPTAPAGSLRECCRHRNHGFSAVRSVTTDCAGGWSTPRECAVIETMASAPCVALLSTAPAGGLRECAVIETMASAPYVALLPTAPAVVYVNVPSSKPWLQRRT
ncbi:hypothetical protein EVAR_91169_1 [Eumeta japonica]|uniref:Uncharacterized protein n=1 Tax=Eumeta variegata TaxID=151549 RepID=A0A4C1ZKB6_EUMVA|nr:hypothetical protein EVAR_91169_1 [Eumeta japonica]